MKYRVKQEYGKVMFTATLGEISLDDILKYFEPVEETPKCDHLLYSSDKGIFCSCCNLGFEETQDEIETLVVVKKQDNPYINLINSTREKVNEIINVVNKLTKDK
jgi:DUF1680 family protein